MVNTPKNLPKLHKYSQIAEQREAVEKCAYLYTLPTYCTVLLQKLFLENIILGWQLFDSLRTCVARKYK